MREHYSGEGLVESQPDEEDRKLGRREYQRVPTDPTTEAGRREARRRFKRLRENLTKYNQ